MFLFELIEQLEYLEGNVGPHAEVYIQIDNQEIEVFGLQVRLREEDGEYDVVIE